MEGKWGDGNPQAKTMADAIAMQLPIDLTRNLKCYISLKYRVKTGVMQNFSLCT